MPIATVTNKYQVVIPRRVREQIGVAIGDVLDAKAIEGKIVFEPKSVADRGITEGWRTLKKDVYMDPTARSPQR